LRFGFLRHAFNAAASFCALLNGFAFGFAAGTAASGGGVMFPAPLNVALAGAPKIVGWGAAGARQDSVVAHGDGVTSPAAVHGELTLHSCAS
jgi:hypothetical protein